MTPQPPAGPRPTPTEAPERRWIPPAARGPSYTAGSALAAASRLYRALAALDEVPPGARGACRAAAFRYLERVQREGVGPGTALCRLRAAAALWVPARIAPSPREQASDHHTPNLRCRTPRTA